MPIALIVKADEPALFFSSVRSAEDSLEAIDVRNGVYPAAYGPNGEPYTIDAQGERVVIERSLVPLAPDELRAILKTFLAAVGAETQGDLGELLSACENYIEP